MTSSDIKSLINTFVRTNYSSCVARKIGKCICSGNGSFLDLVACLETPLTSTKSDERAAGTQLLADVLHQLPFDLITDEQLTFLCGFFIQRMKDHHTVLPAVLHASTALMQQLHISAADVEKFLRGLLLEVHCQSQLMMVRHNIYSTLRLCLTHHLAVVDGMFNEFVLGLVSAAEGERDPRNLLLVFSIVPLVAASSSRLGNMLEDLFEVVAAYFPIDFVPPSHDPHSVSTEDLVLALRRCLACTAAWAHLLLPLLLEKMESNLTAAKIESYHTMSAACSGYSAPHITEHLLPLWGCVRRDVVEAGSDSEVTRAALRCLTDLTAVPGWGLVEVQSRDVFLNKVLEECAVHLSAPDSRLWEPALFLLAAVMEGGLYSADIIFNKVVGSVCQQLQERISTGDTGQGAVNTMAALHRLLLAATRAQDSEGLVSAAQPTLPEGMLSRHGEQCVETLSLAMLCPSNAVAAEAIAAARTAFCCTKPYWRHLLQQIVKVLLSNKGKQDSVRFNALSALLVPSEFSSELLSEHLLPLLLCDSTPVNSEVLDAIAAVTRGQVAVQQVLAVLWPLLETCPTPALCCCCAKIFELNTTSVEVQQYLLERWGAVQRLTDLGVSIALPLPAKDIHSGEVEPLFQALVDLGRTLGTLSLPLSAMALAEAMLLLTAAGGYQHPKGSDGGPTHQLLLLRPDAAQLLPVTQNNCGSSSHLVFVLQSLLVCCREMTPLPDCGLSPLLAWATQASVPARCRLAAAQLIATVLNKMTGAPFLALEQVTWGRVEALLKEGGDVERRRAAVAVVGWVTTALEMKAAPEARRWMEKLQSLLSHPALGVSAASCYSLLLTDHPDVLSTKTFAKVRLLYKQRVFESVVVELVSLFEKSSGSARHCSLLALAALLADLPHSLLQQHMHKLVAVVVEGVRCTSEAAVVEGTVSTLHRLLAAHRPPRSELAPHTGALVPALLALAAASRRPGGGQVRQQGCLHEATNRLTKGAASKSEAAIENEMELDGNICDELILSEIVQSLSKLSDEAAREELQLTKRAEDSKKTHTISNSGIGSLRSSSVSTGEIAPPQQPITVREQSLQCLELLAGLPLEDILPYKDQVIRGLKAAVSDHKRVVRAAAAAARLAWMQAGS